MKNFNRNGYSIIDDFLEKSLYEDLLNKFKAAKKWSRIDQCRDYYAENGPFEMNSKYFPNHDEKYYMQGWRAKELEVNKDWRKEFSDIFLSKIEKLFNSEVKNDTTYILKYMKNDFSRIHVDDLRGDVERVDLSILYYLCDEWIWDWGGILMIAENTESEDMQAILPKNNRIILINNQMKIPHCVTPVTAHAKNHRYSIASFIGFNKPFNIN